MSTKILWLSFILFAFVLGIQVGKKNLKPHKKALTVENPMPKLIIDRVKGISKCKEDQHMFYQGLVLSCEKGKLVATGVI